MLRERRHRHTAALRLEAQDSAARGGQANGAAAVGAEGDWGHSRSHGHSRTARRAAGGEVVPPRIEGGSVAVRDRFGATAELRHRRFADDDRACGAHAADHFAVGCGRRRVSAAAEGGRQTGDVELFLHSDGHARQEPSRVGGWTGVRTGGLPSLGFAGQFGVEPVGLGKGLLGSYNGEGVELWIEAADAFQRRCYELARGPTPRPHSFGHLACRQLRENVLVHNRILISIRFQAAPVFNESLLLFNESMLRKIGA